MQNRKTPQKSGALALFQRNRNAAEVWRSSINSERNGNATEVRRTGSSGIESKKKRSATEVRRTGIDSKKTQTPQTTGAALVSIPEKNRNATEVKRADSSGIESKQRRPITH